MRRAVVFVLLVLAGAAFAVIPPAADLSVVPAHPVAGYSLDQIGPSGGRYAYAIWGNTLRRSGQNENRYVNLALGHSSAASAAPGLPAWKRAGAYTVEFAVSAVGALIAEAGGLTTIEGVYQAGWNGPGSVPGAVAYCVTSAVLTAGGTHLVGRLFGHGNTFNRALAGGAIGGLLGGAAFVDYFVTRKNPHTVMLPIGLVLPPLCTVIVYNVWRNDGTK